MNRKRTRPNWFRIIILSLLVLGGAYLNRFVIPNQPQFGVPTPTPTRAPESFVTEAQEYFTLGKLIPAIASYKQAIASNPNDPAVYVALARVQVWAGQYPEAQSSAESALLLNNDNSMAHAVLAWSLDFQEQYTEAEASITRALELDPNNAIAHAYHVEILVDAAANDLGPINAIEQAIEESRVAISLDPNTLETRRARGYILENTKNNEAAIREYEEAIKINGNIADLHLALGRNYRVLEFYDKAINAFTDANALNPEDPLPDLFLSRTYATIGKYAQAMQHAETAVDNRPSDTNLHGNLGVMYYRNAYFEDAVRELGYVINGGLTEEGVQMELINLTPNAPRIAEYYFTYGLALSRLNQCGEALQIAQTILARIPTDELAVEQANAIVSRCQQNLVETPVPLPTSSEPAPVSTEVSTPTP
ncbi:MAG: tetratricopeptide repeat protein [Anaerolineales bacterium]|nr:tetratricopeptide repeat protein [Anaerolineales bacterium]